MTTATNVYRVQVKTMGDQSWSGNAMEYDTAEAAEEAARDLFGRWLATTAWRVIHNEDGGEVVDAAGP